MYSIKINDFIIHLNSPDSFINALNELCYEFSKENHLFTYTLLNNDTNGKEISFNMNNEEDYFQELNR